MDGTPPPSPADATGAGDGKPTEVLRLALHAEQAVVSKRVRRTLVRAATVTAIRQETVEAELSHEQVVVERVPIGRVVESVPPVRQEGDVTVMPVVEEEFVLVRRLVLKEEVHLRKIRTVTRHAEAVSLRTQTVSVTRTELED